MLNQFNLFLQKYMALFTIGSLVVGVALHSMGAQFLFAVPYLFAFMTLVGSLRMRFSDLKIFYRAPGTILLCLLILHVVMPAISYVIARLLFHDPLLIIGFVILMSVPTGVTSVIWISVTRGDMPLGLAVILLDTLLAPLILPLTLHIVAQQSVQLDTYQLIIGLLLMIVLPTLLGIVINELSKGRLPDVLVPALSPFSKMSLFLIVLINGSAIAPYVKSLDLHLALIILTVLFVAALGYALTMVISKAVRQPFDRKVTFTFICGMRNISTGVIIATTYFPAKVAMPVVFGMLFQQALASLFSRKLIKEREQLERMSIET